MQKRAKSRPRKSKPKKRREPAKNGEPAKEDGKPEYIPIILRTGLLHSYKRTSLVFFVVLIIQWIAIIPAGLALLGLFAQIYWFILFSVSLIEVWAIRLIVTDFDELFDVFESKTKELGMYTELNRPKTKIQEEIRGLFQNGEYTDFREEVKQIIFNKKERWLLLGSLIPIIIFLYLWFTGERAWSYWGVRIWPFTYITEIAWGLQGAFFIFFASGALYLLYAYIRAVNLIGAHRKKLSVWKSIEQIEKKETKNDEQPKDNLMSYQGFYAITKTIGSRVYRVSLRLSAMLVIFAIAGFHADMITYGQAFLLSWVISIITISGAIVILILPQLTIHFTLSDVKERVYKSLTNLYGTLQIRFVTLLKQVYGKKRITTKMKERLAYLKELEELRCQIQEIDKEATWPIRVPDAMKVIGTSLIPLILTLIQTILILLGR